MSTRGCVAIKTKTGWRGVYNHWDSYPKHLGKELWNYLRGKDLKIFAEELLRFDTWGNFLNEGVCPYCGRRGLSTPHSVNSRISGREFGKVKKYLRDLSDARFKNKEEMRRYYRNLPAWRGEDERIERIIEEEWEIRRNIRRTGFPDPAAKYHRHDPLDLSRQHITNENPDPLFIEWVYVVDPSRRTIDVLASQGYTTRGNPNFDDPKPVGNGYFDYGHCRYRHVRVARVSLDHEEPNWKHIDDLTHNSLALEDLLSEEQLVVKQLKGGKIEKTKCKLCGRPAFTDGHDVAHKLCLQRAIEKLGGDAKTWIQGLELEFKHAEAG